MKFRVSWLKSAPKWWICTKFDIIFYRIIFVNQVRPEGPKREPTHLRNRWPTCVCSVILTKTKIGINVENYFAKTFKIQSISNIIIFLKFNQNLKFSSMYLADCHGADAWRVAEKLRISHVISDDVETLNLANYKWNFNFSN